MKAKLYTLLTGLLMAVCVTSYGQEIVGEFNYSFGKAFTDNSLATCSDGSVLSGIICLSNSFGTSGFHICKASSECELIDSVTFVPENPASVWELYEIPNMSDTFLVSEFVANYPDSIFAVKMTTIDADLNIINTVTDTVLSGFHLGRLIIDASCIAPNGDLIVSYWIGDTFHLERFGLDGTHIASQTTDSILPFHFSYAPPADSALHYESFGIFKQAPLRFYKLGGYIHEESEPSPNIAYLFDEDLNLTDTIVYSYLDGNAYCDYNLGEHIVPIDKNSYLLATNIRLSGDYFENSLIEYDRNNHPVSINPLEAPSSVINIPINTVVVDRNTIYHTYQTFPFYPNNINPIIKLARLNESLHVVWNIELPEMVNTYCVGANLKVLANGDIAVGAVSYQGIHTQLHIYIIHDNDPSKTSENTAAAMPFIQYPNPAKDHLTLRFDDGDEPESVELYDLAGRLVGTKPNGLESIDMSAMTSGVYMLRVTMKDGARYHEKILKE